MVPAPPAVSVSWTPLPVALIDAVTPAFAELIALMTLPTVLYVPWVRSMVVMLPAEFWIWNCPSATPAPPLKSLSSVLSDTYWRWRFTP